MINALLMFGPCHGKTFEIEEGKRDVLVPEENGTIMYQRYDEGASLVPIHHKAHRYVLLDEFSSSNCEDVAVYTHEEDCCDTTITGEPKGHMAQAKMSRAGISFGNPMRYPSDIYARAYADEKAPFRIIGNVL